MSPIDLSRPLEVQRMKPFAHRPGARGRDGDPARGGEPARGGRDR
jgi:hypothetical protein